MPANDEAFLKRLRAAFQIEAEEHVQAMAGGLIELESGTDPARRQEIIEMIYREAHSLKGAARAVNNSEIESVCQALESVFSAWKRGEAEPAREQFDALHRAVNLVGELLTPGSGAATQVSAVTASLSSAPLGKKLTVQKAPAPRELAAPMASPAGAGSSQSAPPRDVAAAKSTAEIPSEAQRASGLRAATNPAPQAPQTTANRGETVRISAAKLDAVLLQAEEMLALKSAAKARTAELRALSAGLTRWKAEWAGAEAEVRAWRRSVAPDSPSQATAEFLDWNLSFFKSLDARLQSVARRAEQEERSIGGSIDELLADAKRLVMLPFGRVTEGFPRLVRELAREQGKDVQFLLSGQDVEIDKRILEEMKDPLVHLLRNCVDHGVEMPADRVAAGKPARATLEMRVLRSGASEVAVCVSDDGRGIAVERVKAAAVGKGILGEEEAARMSDEQARELIFRAELSTSPEITEISGRGLGMAIVRERVAKLSGRLVLQSEAGCGTTFRISLPLTLATLRGLTVQAAGQSFVVPLHEIERVARICPDDVQTVEGHDTITLQGRVLPLVRLAEVLGLAHSLDAGRAAADRLFEVLILGVAEEQIAFRVDAVGSESEILVKGLGWPLLHVRNIAGATTLADGKPAPILRVTDLLKSSIHRAHEPRGVATRPCDTAEMCRACGRGFHHFADALKEHSRIRRLPGQDRGRWCGRACRLARGRFWTRGFRHRHAAPRRFRPHSGDPCRRPFAALAGGARFRPRNARRPRARCGGRRERLPGKKQLRSKRPAQRRGAARVTERCGVRAGHLLGATPENAMGGCQLFGR